MFKISYCKFDFDQLCAIIINVQNKACGVEAPVLAYMWHCWYGGWFVFSSKGECLERYKLADTAFININPNVLPKQ